MKFKMLNKKIEKHFKEQKEKLIKDNENPYDNIYFKVLEQREEMKFIKKLDKSRSSLHIIKRNQILDAENNKNNNNLFTNINNKKNNEIKNNKNLEKKSSLAANKNGDNSENIQLKINLGLKKNSIANNKVTFNIKIKDDDAEEILKEEMKINPEKENNKDKSKKIKKGNPDENNKTEKEISLNFIKENNNNKTNEIKDNDIQKEKKKSTNKKG